MRSDKDEVSGQQGDAAVTWPPSANQRMVLVYCDAESHARRRTKVQTFLFDETQKRWKALPPARRTPDGFDWTGGPSPLSYLDGDDNLLERSGQIGRALKDENEAVRMNVRLKCASCGLELRKQSNDLLPYIAQASNAGVSEISLRALVAIMG